MACDGKQMEHHKEAPSLAAMASRCALTEEEVLGILTRGAILAALIDGLCGNDVCCHTLDTKQRES